MPIGVDFKFSCEYKAIALKNVSETRNWKELSLIDQNYRERNRAKGKILDLILNIKELFETPFEQTFLSELIDPKKELTETFINDGYFYNIVPLLEADKDIGEAVIELFLELDSTLLSENLVRLNI